MKCPKCGKELRRSKKDPAYGLCDNCRKKIKWVDKVSNEEVMTPHQTPRRKNTGSELKKDVKTNKKKSLKWIIPIIIIVILASCACIWYFQIKLPHNKAVEDFNSAVKSVEEENAKLDEAVNIAQAIIDSGEQPYDASALIAVTTAITDAGPQRRQFRNSRKKQQLLKMLLQNY